MQRYPALWPCCFTGGALAGYSVLLEAAKALWAMTMNPDVAEMMYASLIVTTALIQFCNMWLCCADAKLYAYPSDGRTSIPSCYISIPSSCNSNSSSCMNFAVD